jgi:xanthine/CO dehydrogenase XdhC/CoxF family maturation factor
MSMKERREIVRLCRTSGTDGGMLFSLIQVTDSSDGPSGARMLVMADGSFAGTVSDVHLETELLGRNQRSIPFRAVVEQFVPASNDPGVNEISFLAESLTTPEALALLDAMEATAHGMQRIVATVLPDRNPLSRIVLDQATDVLFASDALSTPDIVDVRSAALRAAHGSIVDQAGVRIFVERLDPAPEDRALAVVSELQQELLGNAGIQMKARRTSVAEAEQLLATGPDSVMKRETCGIFEVDAVAAAEAAQKATVPL